MSQLNEGLVHAYILDGSGGVKSIDWNGVLNWREEQGPLWLHLDYESADARRWLEEHSKLDEIAIQSLLAEESRPRCARLGPGLQLNLRGVNSNPGADPEDMVSIRVFCDGQRLVSTRRRRLLSVTDICSAFEQGLGPDSLGELVSLLSVRLTDRMSDVIYAMDDVIDQMEDEVVEHSGQQHRGRIVELRRQVIMLRRYLAPQREALLRLSSESVPWLTDKDRLVLRESTDRVTRYIEELDSCRDRAAVLYEELSSRLAEQLNSRMYVLSIVAAIFLPLGFLTGLFGINVGGIPLADNTLGFVLISLMMILMVGFQLLLFRIKKWF